MTEYDKVLFNCNLSLSFVIRLNFLTHDHLLVYFQVINSSLVLFYFRKLPLWGFLNLKIIFIICIFKICSFGIEMITIALSGERDRALLIRISLSEVEKRNLRKKKHFLFLFSTFFFILSGCVLSFNIMIHLPACLAERKYHFNFWRVEK